MTHPDSRLTELKARLTALDSERAAIIAEIEVLRSVPAAGAPPPNTTTSEQAGHVIDRHSTIETKIALFRSLFRGRADVFPIRWENTKTGRSGYAPACSNEWKRGVCEKPKVKCSACPNQAFVAVDEMSIERHLRGTARTEPRSSWASIRCSPMIPVGFWLRISTRGTGDGMSLLSGRPVAVTAFPLL